ncbi:MAG: DegT/DnrJ/EryC1/StrS family aminotransferase [Terriglobales bacterium]
MENVPFVDLRAQYAGIKQEVLAAITRVLESSQFVLGDAVAEFERNFASYCTTREAVAVNSGTSALHLALLAAGIGPGDEVITTPFTFVASVAAILYAGARPVLVDIDPVSFNIDPQKIEAAITPRTRAILPVHLYGQMADMDPIVAIARRHKLLLIEDAAQAVGAEYKGRRAGSIGDLGCFSFYPSKNLGAYGEGGAVTTSNAEYAAKLCMLRNWGEDRKYHHILRGYNYRMEGIQGAILNVKLGHLEAWTEARRSHVARYRELLPERGVGLPQEMQYARHVYHVFTVRSVARDGLQQALASRGIQTGLHYPAPVHMQPAYADIGYQRGDFPHAEKAAAEVLSLPLFAEMTEEQIVRVAAALKEALSAMPAGQRA